MEKVVTDKWFAKCCKVLEKKDPELLEKLKQVDASHLVFCETKEGEANLENRQEGYTYHDPKGALNEANLWAQTGPWDRVITAFFFGVGLGYHYRSIKQWLRARQEHRAVFFEDDLAVIKRLCETEIGFELLDDEQVRLVYFEDPVKDGPKLSSLIVSCQDIQTGSLPLFFDALPTYQSHRKQMVSHLSGQLRGRCDRELSVAELLADDSLVLQNHFLNCKQLPFSYLGAKLRDCLKGIPAIVCGGGPSLAREANLLRQLDKKALIIGAGSGANALGELGIRPHLCCGMDPNVIQESRLLTQKVFEVPFAYSLRIASKGMEAVQAPKVYLGKPDVARWIEEYCGIDTFYDPENAMSIGNAAVLYATYLGCGPIILLGMDLSYQDKQHYSPGVMNHPLLEKKKNFKTDQTIKFRRQMSEDAEHVTTVAFMKEHEWYKNYCKEHPEVKIYNASIGGMEVEEMATKSLQEIAREELLEERDIRGMLHASIFQFPLHAITLEKVKQALQEWKRLMDQSAKWCSELAQKLQETTSENGGQSLCDQLQKLPTYCYYLKYSQQVHENILEAKRKNWFKERTNEDDMNMYLFLCGKAKGVSQVIDEVLHQFKKAIDRDWNLIGSKKGIEECDLPTKILPKNEGSEQWILTYPTGEIQATMEYENNQLHGRATWYSENGRILSVARFERGLEEGPCFRYYASGALYAVENYKKGKLHGEQLYFYEDGAKRTILHYDKGELHGDVWEYHPEGDLKREMHFSSGKRNGYERLWDETPKMRMQTIWKEDVPVKAARQWDHNENLLIEVEFGKNGKAKRVVEYEGEEQLQQMHKEATDLNQAMEHALESLKGVDWKQIEKELKKETGEAFKNIEEIQRKIRGK